MDAVLKRQPRAGEDSPLIMPRTLYGRSPQRRIITTAWKNVSQKKQIIAVNGPPGVGKTALINSLDTLRFRKTGRFIRGKFDQVGSHTPYGAVADAFEMALGWIMGQDQPIFELWRKKLSQALEINAQLIIDIVPCLEKILGIQPPVPTLLPVAEKNRFAYVVKTFIKALTHRRMPLVLFLDDLQWADSPSMELIRIICLSDDIEHLLFIGACRDNEIQKDHPWAILTQELEEKSNAISQIRLPPLTLGQTCKFISHTLGASPKAVKTLGDATLRKTGGNPLLIREFLTSIHQKNLLTYTPKHHSWKWAMEEINGLPADENAVLLISRWIRKLTPDILPVLVNAASMGSPFEINLLAMGTALTLDETKKAMAPAIQASVIIPLKISGNEPARYYRFTHDSIQQAVLESLPPEKRFQNLQHMGQRLLEHYSPTIPQDRLFMVTNLINAGGPLQSPKEMLRAANLNCDSGKRALDTAAYDPALSYFITGINRLKALGKTESGGGSFWSVDERLALSLYQGAAQAAFLLGQYDKMDKYIRCVDHHIHDPVLKTKLYEIKTSSLYARNKMDEAIDTAMTFAASLGIRFPKHPGKGHILTGWLLTTLRLINRSPEDLSRLPKMTDPKVLSVLRVLSCASLAIFYARPNLLPLIVFKSIRLSIRYGNTDASAFGYAGYGLILCGRLNQMELGNRFGRLATEQIRNHGLKPIEARTTATVQGFILHWKTHLNQTRAPLLAAHKIALETGDHQFAAICATSYCTAGFHSGSPLKKLFSRMSQFEKLIRNLKQNVVLNALHIFYQTTANLMGSSPAPWYLKGQIYDIEIQTPKLKESNDHLALFTQYYLSLMLCLVFGKYQEAVRFADAARAYSDTARGMPEMAFFIFYDSLARLSVLSSTPPGRQTRHIKRIKSNHKLLKKWAKSVPMNIQHKCDLIQAQIYKHKKLVKKAGHSFEMAVKGAKDSGYLNDQALACEFAGKFHISRTNDTLARKYLSMAHELYFQWGALAKTTQMEQRYPPYVLRQPGSATTDMILNDKNLPDKAYPPQDLHTILQAARTIARETRFNPVMEKLTQLIMEHSGARKVFVLLYEDVTLKLQAFGQTDPNRIRIGQNIPFDPYNRYLPASVIHYVIRSDQTVILENAPESELFYADPYIANRLPLSIFSTPIFNKNMKAGLLYLENDLIQGAFTQDRLKIIDIFLSQAVVSLESSKLYDSLNKEKKQKDAAFNKINFQKKILKNMSAELAMVEERERKAIADDLHDSVTQTLALGALELKKLNTLDPPPQKKMAQVQAHLEEAMSEIRSLTFRLSPKILYDFGLAAALEWLADDIHDRYDLKVVFIDQLQDDIQLNDTANFTLYRAVRELLINTVKHAETRLAIVQLAKEARKIAITVKDNGKGFDIQEKERLPDQIGSGFGLVSIRERIHALNGSIQIRSQKDKGTRILITLPLNENKEP